VIEAKKSASEPRPERKTRWAWTFATFFGAGYLRPGPGTYGSIAAVLLWYLLARATHPGPFLLALSTAITAVLVTAIGITASTLVARESGRHDPGFVVIDEVAGQLVALILTPAFGQRAWAHIVLALLLFRLFDITKPQPIRRLEALPEGAGIMLDDIAAGLFALLAGVLLVALAHHLHKLP
jgi:phosphatidylglycerophosphatase A